MPINFSFKQNRKNMLKYCLIPKKEYLCNPYLQDETIFLPLDSHLLWILILCLSKGTWKHITSSFQYLYFPIWTYNSFFWKLQNLSKCLGLQKNMQCYSDCKLLQNKNVKIYKSERYNKSKFKNLINQKDIEIYLKKSC